MYTDNDYDPGSPCLSWRTPATVARDTASISGQSIPSGLALQRTTMASSQAAPRADKPARHIEPDRW
jgi:hypothetical protein